MICTFFGHKNTPDNIKALLKETIRDLIENRDVKLFYVGNQGNFDNLARKSLEELKKEYPTIQYWVVLAYMPVKKDILDYRDYSITMFPDGLENVPPKFAIDKRNRWMLNESDYVVSYVKHIVGGAAKFNEIAIKKGKVVYNLAEKAEIV